MDLNLGQNIKGNEMMNYNCYDKIEVKLTDERY